jgi:O-antigen/teichoic acid export membrane protein
LVLELFAQPISGFVLGSAEYTHFFQIIFVSMALQTIAVVPESLLLAKKRSITFSTITLLTFVSYLSLNVLFIVGMKMGVMGMVLSTVITKALNVIMLFAVTRSEFGLRFSFEKFKAMLSYSLPLLPAGLCMFAIHYSDRYFIQKFVSLEDLGLYSLGYKFGMIISLVVTQPIFRIWNTQRYEIAKEPDSEVVFGRMFTYIVFAFLAAGLLISTLIDETIAIMAPAHYQGASQIVSLIVAGYILFGCASFMQLGMFINYKTKYIVPIQFSAALLNVGLNLVLIPLYGIMGAAIATMLTFFCLALFSFLVSQRLLPVKYEYSRVIRLVFLSVGLYFVSRIIDLPLVFSVVAKISLLCLFPALLYLSGFFNGEEIAKGKDLFRQASLRFRRSGAGG